MSIPQHRGRDGKPIITDDAARLARKKKADRDAHLDIALAVAVMATAFFVLWCTA